MKNLFRLSFIALVSLLLTSCNDDNGPAIKSIYAKKIDSVDIPKDTILLGETMSIKLFSTYTKGCEGFYDYNYIYDVNNQRFVINYAYKSTQNCEAGDFVYPSVVNFKPIEKGSYSFKFWNGLDANNKNIWLEKNVVVE